MSSSTPIVLHADQEHDSLRTAVVLFLILLFFLSFWLVRQLLNLELFGVVRDYAFSLACVGGLVLALGITAAVEIGLKRVWHSGRHLVLDEQGIGVHNPGQAVQYVRRDEGLAGLAWYFHLRGYRRGGREKRISSRWQCLAYQLQQGDKRLIVYSYLPPNQAAKWLQEEDVPHRFRQIRPADVYESSLARRLGAPARPHLSNEIITGKDGRHWLAERHRWAEGFELTPADFAIFMDKVAGLQSNKAA